MRMIESVTKALAPAQERLFDLLEALLDEQRETNRQLRQIAEGTTP